MADSIGTMTIDVRGNVAGLTKDLNRMKGQVRKSSKSMKKSFKSVGVALAGVFAGGAVLNGMKNFVSEMDKINKTAAKLGTTTEQLSSLGFAAERAGVKATTFEMAMQRMTRRAAEAGVGLGEAKAALKELGIDAVSFADISLEEKMYLLSDSFKNVTSEADQLRLAFKLFDSEGAALVNMLKDGSGQIKDFQQISDKLGKTLKSSVAQEASAAADAISNFQAAFTGIANSIATKLLPTLNTALNTIQDLFNIPRIKTLKELTEDADKLYYQMRRIKNAGNVWTHITPEQTANRLAPVKKEFDEIQVKIKELKQTAEANKIQIKVNKEELKATLTDVQTAGIGVADAIGSSMGSAFDSMMEGAFSFKDTMKNVLKSVLKELIKVFIIQKAVGAIKGGFGVPNIDANAKGGVFQGGSKVKAFAKGGIVDSPTNFPMSGNNVGLMGEAGPEAIMPLKRGSDGGLGVAAAPVNIEIINNAGASVSAQQDGDNIRVMIEQVENSIAGGIRKGTGPVGSAIQGMKQQGRL